MDKNSRLALQHYNSDKPLQGTLISNSTENFCTVKLTNKPSLVIKKGDPVIIGLLNNEEQIKLVGGNIIGTNVDINNCDNFVIATDKEYLASEKRQFERFPVSLYGNFKREGFNKIFEVAVKDISCNGLKFYSKEIVEVGEIVNMDLFLLDQVRIFTCQILRQAKYFDRYEYGISIIHKDRNSISATDAFINVLRSTQFAMMDKFL